MTFREDDRSGFVKLNYKVAGPNKENGHTQEGVGGAKRRGEGIFGMSILLPVSEITAACCTVKKRHTPVKNHSRNSR